MKIWAAWLQGREAAPPNVRAILSLWERLHPAHDLHVVTQVEADAILQRLAIRQDKISPQVTTNLVRLALLQEHGGTWVDATLLPTKRLDDWLGPLREPAGVFAFSSSGDPNLVLQNWFISADVGNPLIRRLLEVYSDYFQVQRRFPTWKRAVRHGAVLDLMRFKRKVAERDTLWFADPDGGRGSAFYPYAAFNYNLAWLLTTDPDVKANWERVPHRTAMLPHLIGRLAGDADMTDEAFLRHATGLLDVSPVHKLNYRDGRFKRLIAIAADRLGV